MLSRILFFLVSLVFVFPGGPFAEEREIKGFGDHSLWVLVNDVKGVFTEDTGVPLNLIGEFAIGGKGCDKGILHAARGRPDRDFGLICCGMDKAVIEKYSLVTYAVAHEPLAIIVNRRNPVKNLSLKEVREIFSGKITNWKEVGGWDENIIVITRLHCLNYTPNWMLILGRPEDFSKKRVDVLSEPDMSKTVGDFTEAIGHLEMTSVKESVGNIKLISVNGYEPTGENLEKGFYPLFTTLSVVTRGEAEGNVRKFIEYLRKSPKVKRVMRKYGMNQIK